jgi:hypothetical protein
MATPPTSKPEDSAAARPPDDKKLGAPPPEIKTFDRAAALLALSAAAGAAQGCKPPGGPTGSGKVRVTFAPNGSATSAALESGPFEGTPIAGCLLGVFRATRVPVFEGAPVSVSKTFSIR